VGERALEGVLAATNDGEGHSSLIILIHDVTNRVKIWG
jgi:hypothetical protein